MELIRQDDNGKTYQADGFRVYYRNAGHISGDNDINVREYIYVLQGEANVIIGDETHELVAPSHIEIPAKTYHAITGKTDIVFVVQHPDGD